METPQVAWRFFLGGNIARSGFRFVDIDADQNEDFLFIAGGKVVAKTRKGIELWSTVPMAAQHLIALEDLDNDGQQELVVQTATGAAVIELASGAILWRQPFAEIGTLAATRLADFDSDGTNELLTISCPCCAKRNGATGATYDFAGGASNPQLVWSPASVRCGSQSTTTILSAGGGANVLLGQRRGFSLEDGATGTTLATSGDLSASVELSHCQPANIDADNDEEALCVVSASISAEPGTGHRVFALDVQGNQISTLWSTNIGEQDNALSFNGDSIVDVDNDGSLEVILSGVDASGDDVVEVIDAISGNKLAAANGRFTGVVGAGNDQVVVAEVGDDTQGLTFNRNAGTLTTTWTIADRSVVAFHDPTNKTTALTTRLDKQHLYLEAEKLLERYAIGAPPSLQGSLTLPENTRVGAVAAGSSEIGISINDGYIRVTSQTLVETTDKIRAGGYYASADRRQLCKSPVVGKLASGTRLGIVVPSSSQTLLALDATTADSAQAPAVAWTLADATCPLIDESSRVLASIDGDDADEIVSISGDTGQINWRHTLPGRILADLVVGNFNDSGNRDVVVQWSLESNRILQQRAIDGDTGQELWSAVPMSRGDALFPSGGAVYDMTGDGIDDFIGHFFSTYILDGVDGSVESENTPGISPYYMPTVVDIDADADKELFLHAGVYPTEVLDADLALIKKSDDDNRPYLYYAVAPCGDDLISVGPSLSDEATLYLTPLNGSNAHQSQRVALAGGRLYADEAAAQTDGAEIAQLASAYVHNNLQGDNRAIALIGSASGWLYAVDACDASLAFSLRLDGAVGAIAFGDNDGDGLDEVLVSAADGFLYALKQFALIAPRNVIDIDPNNPGSEDVDEITSSTRVIARWEAVTNATYYEVAVVRQSDGIVITAPDWIRAEQTEAEITVAMEKDTFYKILVRGQSDAGASPATESDGFVVTSEDALTVGGGGCGCNGNQGAAAILWVLVGIAGLRLFRTISMGSEQTAGNEP